MNKGNNVKYSKKEIKNYAKTIFSIIDNDKKQSYLKTERVHNVLNTILEILVISLSTVFIIVSLVKTPVKFSSVIFFSICLLIAVILLIKTVKMKNNDLIIASIERELTKKAKNNQSIESYVQLLHTKYSSKNNATVEEVKTIKCSYCGVIVTNGAVKCEYCGAAIKYD